MINSIVRTSLVLAGLSLLSLTAEAAEESPAESLVETIWRIGDQGQGNADAITALKSLTQLDAAALPTILAGFRDANPIAANWLRSAFESIMDRSVKTNAKLPAAELRAFILDTANDPRARRMTFEWLSQVETSLGDELIPGMLLDPSPEFRRDAVTRIFAEAEALTEQKKQDEAIAAYRKALSGAVDEDQVKEIVQPLKALGESVDLQQHFGFLTHWKIIGPFDNRDRKGYGVAYPPETELNFNKSCEGQLGEVTWQEITTDDDYGLVDIAKQLENHKGSCMYAATEFISDTDQAVEFRLGTPNSWKLWVNGKLVFQREEYHRGTKMDQYRVTVPMHSGSNTILLKICQNEQTEDWAQRYQYQLRICHGDGSAVVSTAQRKTSQARSANSTN